MYATLCGCMAVLNAFDAVELKLQVEWLDGFSFQGHRYGLGCHLKMATSTNSCAALLLHVMAVRVQDGWQYILVYKQLQRLSLQHVQPESLKMFGKNAWYYNRNKLYATGGSKKVSCLAFVDVNRCKLVPVHHGKGDVVLLSM